MAFPTLFPTRTAMINQPRIAKVDMQEYALHLMRFHNNHFGQHPSFHYYLYNLIMWHRSQAIASIFIKRDLANNLPAIVANLCLHLPPSTIPNQIMCFSSSLRKSHSFWTRSRGELSDMIIQQGNHTFLFTLNASDTKWHDLHMAMHSNPSSNPHDQTRWRIQNIVSNPHHASQYIHCRFKIFLKEVLLKGFLVKDF